MPRPITYRTGVVLVASAAVMWSLMGLAIRALGDASTWAVLFYRSLGIAPVIVLLIATNARGNPLPAILHAGWSGLIGGACLVAAFAGAIFAIQSTTIANAVLLFAAAPLITALLSRVVLGESVRPLTWAAIGLAALGMFIMVREGLALGAGWGNAAALLSALGFSGYTLILRRGRGTDMLPALLIGSLLSVVTAYAVLTATGGTVVLPLRSILIAAAAGFVLLGVGMALFTAGSRVVPAAELGLLSMVEVMLAPVWAWVFLGEQASRNTVIGGTILMVALLLNALTGLRQRALV
jgi:drug/metabolite transporter, DME family